MEKSYLTPNQVAELLMVTTESVRQWSNKGWLKAETTPGGHRRFLRHSVERFAQERGLNYARQGSARQGHGGRDDGELRILVVDDETQFANYLVELLSGVGESVVVKAVYDGFSAGVQVYSFRPDIVLLDLMMADINGFEVCKKLKEEDGTRYIKIYAMTGFPSEENVTRIKQAGAEMCFAKPIDTRLLLESLGLKDKGFQGEGIKENKAAV